MKAALFISLKLQKEPMFGNSVRLEKLCSVH